MSLLSDLLSKVKTTEPRRDVPPGLRSTVSGLKNREYSKRRFAILAVLAVSVVALGFGTIYFINIYTKPVKRPAVSLASKAKPDETKIEKGGNESAVTSNKSEDREKESLPVTRSSPPSTIEVPATPVKKKDVLQKMPERSEKKTSEPSDAPEPKRQEPDRKKDSNESTVTSDKSKDRESLPVTRDSSQPLKTEVKEQQNTGIKEMYLYMAENQERKGDFSNAVSSYRKVLEIEQGNYRVMNKIGQILIRMNMHDAAMKYLQDALRLKPDYVPSLINSGIVHARGGNNAEAEKALLKALSIEEANHAALLNIAIFYENQGKYSAAKNYYLKLQRLGNAQGSIGLERIESLKAVTVP